MYVFTHARVWILATAERLSLADLLSVPTEDLGSATSQIHGSVWQPAAHQKADSHLHLRLTTIW